MNDRVAGSRQADDWLQIAETRFGVGFWTWNVADAKFTCSRGLFELIGVSPASVQLDPVFLESLVHPADRLPLGDPGCLASDARQRERRFRLIRPDGQLRWLQSCATSYFDRSGARVRVVAGVIDLTEQQALERRSGHLEALLMNLSKFFNAAFWVASADGQLIDRFSVDERLNVDVAANGPARWSSVLHPDDLARAEAAWTEAVATGRPYDFEGRMRMGDGHYGTIHAAGLPLDRDRSADPYWGGYAASNLHHATGTSTHDTGVALLLTPGQVRACRALLDWTAETLAARAGISVSTIRRLEGHDASQGQGDSMRLVMLAFRDAGLKIWRGGDGRFCVSDTR